MLLKIAVSLLALVAGVAGFAVVRSSQAPDDLWAVTHTFPGCPQRPSCVSSVATDEVHRIEPFRFVGDPAAVRTRLERLVRAMPRSSIEDATPEYIHALFRTPTMHYRDDVELLVQPEGIVQVRSISRFGYGDHGVNRARVEELRAAFEPEPPAR